MIDPLMAMQPLYKLLGEEPPKRVVKIPVKYVETPRTPKEIDQINQTVVLERTATNHWGYKPF